MRAINFIVHHCTAGPQTQTVESILNYWKKDKGWTSPGYHFLVKPDGEAVQLWPIEKPSNGVAGFNSGSLHFCYIGGVEILKGQNKEGKPVNVIGRPLDNRTPEQMETLQDLTERYSLMFPHAVIQGHRDFSPDKNRDGIITPDEWLKSCPSYSVKAWLDSIGFFSKLPTTILRTTAAVNIRGGAGTAFKPLRAALGKGTLVKKLGAANGWTYVVLQDGSNLTGWVSSDYLKACL